MKTPLQEMLEWVRATLPMDLETPRLIEQKIESMLEKEKEKEMNKKYALQWLDEEGLWYLTIHGEDGITFEGWYHSVDEALKDIPENEINKTNN